MSDRIEAKSEAEKELLKDIDAKIEEMLLHQILEEHNKEDKKNHQICIGCIRLGINKGYRYACEKRKLFNISFNADDFDYEKDTQNKPRDIFCECGKFIGKMPKDYGRDLLCEECGRSKVQKWIDKQEKENALEMQSDIKTARRCMNFKLLRCDNKDCSNEFCPLNKVYDEDLKSALKVNVVDAKVVTEDDFIEDAFGEKDNISLTKNKSYIEDKIMKKIIPKTIKFAEDYVNTIDELTGKPYRGRKFDDVHGIKIGEVRAIIRETIKNTNQNKSKGEENGK